MYKCVGVRFADFISGFLEKGFICINEWIRFADFISGFLERRFIFINVWGSLCWFYLIFLKYPIKMKSMFTNQNFIFIGYLKTSEQRGRIERPP